MSACDQLTSYSDADLIYIDILISEIEKTVDVGMYEVERLRASSVEIITYLKNLITQLKQPILDVK